MRWKFGCKRLICRTRHDCDEFGISHSLEADPRDSLAQPDEEQSLAVQTLHQQMATRSRCSMWSWLPRIAAMTRQI
jgi:hypothetical protein